MGNFFANIYIFFHRHKMVLGSLLVLCVALLLFSFSRLRYNENISDFLPKTAGDGSINFIYQQINGTNKILIYFEEKDTTRQSKEDIAEAIDLFVANLKNKGTDKSFRSIISNMDDKDILGLSNYLLQWAPYFLTSDDYRRIDSLRSEPAIRRQLEADKQMLMLPTGGFMTESLINDPIHFFSPLLEQTRNFKINDQYSVENGHIFTDGGRKGIVILTSPFPSSDTKSNAALLKKIENTIRQTNKDYPQIRIHTFGAPVIAVTNAQRIQYDSYLSILLSLILIFSLLIYEIRSARNLMLMAISILFGYLFALGLIAMVHQSISIIVLGMSAIFIGIAVNYSLHYILHLNHEPNRLQALKEIASPLTIGNITTVGAFLSLVFIHSSAMSDMGAFASLLLLGSILFVLIFLPHWVHVPHQLQERKSFSDKLYNFSFERKSYIIIPLLVLTFIFMYFSRYTSFDSNMQNINYMTPEQKADMQSVSQSTEQRGKQVVYVINKGTDKETAMEQYERQLPLLKHLQEKRYVTSIKGVGSLYPSWNEQKRRINRWNEYWARHRQEFTTTLQRLAKEEGFKSDFLQPFTNRLKQNYVPRPASFFTPITKIADNNYLLRKEGTADVTTLVTLLYCNKENISHLERILKERCPKAIVFDSRDILQKMVDYLSGDFNYVLYVSGFIVFVFLILSFGRIELTLLSFLPLVISWFWILGIMQIFGIQFNIVNIILATFIFGEGDDYAIFITEGLMYEYACGKKMLASYKRSVFLSAIIMFIGIGSLVFARHPAMRSLGEVTIVGMFSVVLMACIVPPLLFNWLTKKKGQYREDPITLKRLAYSLYTFIAFLIGNTCITFIGHLLFAFRKRTPRKESVFHRMLMRISRFVVYRIPGVSFHYVNLANETFEKPAIIICNHQSHLDLMCMLMLTPKMIILTNDWTWNNIFYGRLIKYANFYPVSEGIEKCLPQLHEKVKEGYSIMIFPEGTRSDDCSILRFHRGAFYLAQEMGIDIIPVLIHGNGHVLPKNDFMLREGRIDVEVHQRITPTDSRFSEDYAIRSKQVRHYYREKYEDLSRRTEKSVYFKYHTLHNYLYKGPAIERSVRRTLKKNHCFADIIDTFEGRGKVLLTHCATGEAALLFAYAHPDCAITAYEENKEKLAIAAHCNHIPKNLTFTATMPDEVFQCRIDL